VIKEKQTNVIAIYNCLIFYPIYSKIQYTTTHYYSLQCPWDTTLYI